MAIWRRNPGAPSRPVLGILVAAAVWAWLAAAGPAQAQPAPASGCETCHRAHSEATVAAPARLFGATDVHRDRGFTCVDCHGGNPGETDKARAKAPSTGFRGKPSGQAIVAVCARCHSDAAFMRKYAPK